MSPLQLEQSTYVITQTRIDLSKVGNKEIYMKKENKEENLEDNTYITIRTTTECPETQRQVKKTIKKDKESVI